MDLASYWKPIPIYFAQNELYRKAAPMEFKRTIKIEIFISNFAHNNPMSIVDKMV